MSKECFFPGGKEKSCKSALWLCFGTGLIVGVGLASAYFLLTKASLPTPAPAAPAVAQSAPAVQPPSIVKGGPAAARTVQPRKRVPGWMGGVMQRYEILKIKLGAYAAAERVGVEEADPAVAEKLRVIFPEAKVPGAPPPAPPVSFGPPKTLTPEEMGQNMKEYHDRVTNAAVKLYEMYKPKLGPVAAAEAAGMEMDGPPCVKRLQEMFPEAKPADNAPPNAEPSKAPDTVPANPAP